MGKNQNKKKKNKEKEPKNMNENLLYEVKFFETEDGYRLEASGDKALLRRLGIGPRMLGGRKRPNIRSNKRQMRRRRAARQRGPAPDGPNRYPGAMYGFHPLRRPGGQGAYRSLRARRYCRAWNPDNWDNAPGGTQEW